MPHRLTKVLVNGANGTAEARGMLPLSGHHLGLQHVERIACERSDGSGNRLSTALVTKLYSTSYLWAYPRSELHEEVGVLLHAHEMLHRVIEAQPQRSVTGLRSPLFSECGKQILGHTSLSQAGAMPFQKAVSPSSLNTTRTVPKQRVMQMSLESKRQRGSYRIFRGPCSSCFHPQRPAAWSWPRRWDDCGSKSKWVSHSGAVLLAHMPVTVMTAAVPAAATPLRAVARSMAAEARVRGQRDCSQLSVLSQ